MENEQEKPTVSSPTSTALLCDDCGFEIGDDSPVDGWEMEDGRVICHSCCCSDFSVLVDRAIALNKQSDKKARH